MTFLQDVLEWMHQEDIRAPWTLLPATPTHDDCVPKEVTNMITYGSDFANGDTAQGFSGDTDVTITWACTHGGRHETEIRPGEQMGSLWAFMIKKWRSYAGPNTA